MLAAAGRAGHDVLRTTDQLVVALVAVGAAVVVDGHGVEDASPPAQRLRIVLVIVVVPWRAVSVAVRQRRDGSLSVAV